MYLNLHIRQRQQILNIMSLVKVELMAELLNWITTESTGGPNFEKKNSIETHCIHQRKKMEMFIFINYEFLSSLKSVRIWAATQT